MTDEEASVASSTSDEQPESEEEPEEATDPSVGLYLAKWAHAQSLIEDAKHAALSGYYAREAMYAAAERVLDGLEQLNPDQWTHVVIRMKMEAKFGLGGHGLKDVLITNYRTTIAREQMNWPFPLLRTEGVLDVLLRVEKAARKQAGLSEIDRLTSLLASCHVLRAAPPALRTESTTSGRFLPLAREVRAAGVSFALSTIDGAITAIEARLAREDADVRATRILAKATAQLPREDDVANAQLAAAIRAASLLHPKTLEPQDDDEVVFFQEWKSKEAHDEAVRKHREWTGAGPSAFASVGRNNRRYGHSGADRGLPYDYRVGALNGPCPKRLGDAPTVVQPASALARVAQLHDLVDGMVAGENSNEWRRRREAEQRREEREA